MQQLHGGLVSGEVASGVDGAARLAVQGHYGVGCINWPPDLVGEGMEGMISDQARR